MNGGQLDWLLVEFVRDVHGVVSAVVVSGDGLRLAMSPGMDGSLGRGTARLLRMGEVTQSILEMADGYLFVTTISQGAALAIQADRRCDIGMVGYEMTMLAARVGHALTPGIRATAGGSLL